MRAKARKKG